MSAKWQLQCLSAFSDSRTKAFDDSYTDHDFTCRQLYRPLHNQLSLADDLLQVTSTGLTDLVVLANTRRAVRTAHGHLKIERGYEEIVNPICRIHARSHLEHFTYSTCLAMLTVACCSITCQSNPRSRQDQLDPDLSCTTFLTAYQEPFAHPRKHRFWPAEGIATSLMAAAGSISDQCAPALMSLLTARRFSPKQTCSDVHAQHSCNTVEYHQASCCYRATGRQPGVLEH